MEEHLSTVLAGAFGAWAGVVAWLGQGIRKDLQALGEDLKEESYRLNQYIVQTEVRLARLEQNNKEVTD